LTSKALPGDGRQVDLTLSCAIEAAEDGVGIVDSLLAHAIEVEDSSQVGLGLVESYWKK